MISAPSTTLGEGMIAKWPNKTSPPPPQSWDKPVWWLSVCLLMCVASCVSCLGLQISETIFDIFLNDWIFCGTTHSKMCSARWNTILVSAESIFVRTGIHFTRRKIQLHSSWQCTKMAQSLKEYSKKVWNTHFIKWGKVWNLPPHRGQQVHYFFFISHNINMWNAHNESADGWMIMAVWFYAMPLDVQYIVLCEPAWWISAFLLHIYIMSVLCILCLV